jgi:hypothetical protein
MIRTTIIGHPYSTHFMPANHDLSLKARRMIK